MLQLVEPDVDYLDDLFSRTALDDPYSIYDELRLYDPVRWNPLINCWLITRYADASAILSDTARFSSNWPSSYTFSRTLSDGEEASRHHILNYFANFMQTNDPPRHTRLRNALNKAFAPRAVERMREIIQRLVDDLLDKAVGKGYLEIMEDLAYPLPAIVICELLGVPEEERPKFRASAETVAEFLGIVDPAPGQLKEIELALEDMSSHLIPIINEKRRNPQNDMISMLATLDGPDEALTEQELLSACVILLYAGHETTRNLIGNGLLALLSNPAELEKLKADYSLMSKAVDEILRYDNSVQWIFRCAATDVEMHGKLIKKGDKVFLGLGAANRDPEHFSHPDKLDITRKEGRTLTFGYGIHFCIGAGLARMEAQIAFTTMFKRWPNLRLANNTPDWGDNFHFRALKTLPLFFD